ncbi:hypothetical protein PMIN06_011022 [Paraphaeosphaeria minitans]
MARRMKKKSKRRNRRRGSLEILRETIAPSIVKTARAAATQTKNLVRRMSVVLNAGGGQIPVVEHIHPGKARPGSRYSEVDAIYQDGWGAGMEYDDTESRLLPRGGEWRRKLSLSTWGHLQQH